MLIVLSTLFALAPSVIAQEVDPIKYFSTKSFPIESSAVPLQVLVTITLPNNLPSASDKRLLEELSQGLVSLGLTQNGIVRVFPWMSYAISPAQLPAHVVTSTNVVQRLNALYPARALRASNATSRTITLGSTFLFTFNEGIDINKVIATLSLHPLVTRVSRNDRVILHQSSHPSPSPSLSLPPLQWGLDQLEVRKAWAISRGRGITVAVIDSGIDAAHPSLRSALHVNSKEVPNNCIDDDQNGFVDDYTGWDFSQEPRSEQSSSSSSSQCKDVATSNLPVDKLGHGTQISGIIASRGTGVLLNAKSITGVAPSSMIMPIKAFSRDDATMAQVVPALYYAILQGADVINCSFGLPRGATNAEFDNLIDFASYVGVTVVKSSGNDQVASNELSDLFNKNQIKVSGYVDPDSASENSSNIGAYIDIAGPSTNIVSTNSCSLSKVCGTKDEYTVVKGTSAAAAHVSGVVALALEANPALSPEQMRQLLKVTATDVALPGFDFHYGAGVVHGLRAVHYARSLRQNKAVMPPSVQLLSPTYAEHMRKIYEGSQLGVLSIKGTILGAQARQWSLSIKPLLLDNHGWTTLAQGKGNRVEQQLATIVLAALPTNWYLLKLSALDSQGVSYDDYTMIRSAESSKIKSVFLDPDYGHIDSEHVSASQSGVSFTSLSNAKQEFVVDDETGEGEVVVSVPSEYLIYTWDENATIMMRRFSPFIYDLFKTKPGIPSTEGSGVYHKLLEGIWFSQNQSLLVLAIPSENIMKVFFDTDQAVNSTTLLATLPYSQSRYALLGDKVLRQRAQDVVLMADFYDESSDYSTFIHTLRLVSPRFGMAVADMRSSGVCMVSPQLNSEGTALSVLKFDCKQPEAGLELVQFAVGRDGTLSQQRIVQRLVANTPVMRDFIRKQISWGLFDYADSQYLIFNSDIYNWNGKLVAKRNELHPFTCMIKDRAFYRKQLDFNMCSERSEACTQYVLLTSSLSSPGSNRSIVSIAPVYSRFSPPSCTSDRLVWSGYFDYPTRVHSAVRVLKSSDMTSLFPTPSPTPRQ